MTERDELVTVLRCQSLAEAQLVRSRLDADGIAALVMEQDALRLNLFDPDPPPPIRVLVHRDDLADARAALDLDRS